MVKILSQGGRSLADMYDVVGSIAGLEQLESREVSLVHEMGATLFSERFRTTFRRVATTGVLQNVDIDQEITNMPGGISRILGVHVISDAAVRIASCQVSVNHPIAPAQDFPIWVYDSVAVPRPARIEDNNVVGTFDVLVPLSGLTLPTFLTVGQNRGEMSRISLHARTTGFGAGTVDLTMLVHFAFTFTGGVSAFGAQIPSW